MTSEPLGVLVLVLSLLDRFNRFWYCGTARILVPEGGGDSAGVLAADVPTSLHQHLP